MENVKTGDMGMHAFPSGSTNAYIHKGNIEFSVNMDRNMLIGSSERTKNTTGP